MSPPGIVPTHSSAHRSRTQVEGRGGRSLPRDVLLQCADCGSKVTGRVRGGRLVFSDRVTTAAKAAWRAWQAAEDRVRRTGSRTEADRLRGRFMDLRNKPVRLVHRDCGGQLAAFDFHGRAS